jgi:bacillithiol biosynthesis cysteine-adding enzyme BshC
MQKSKINRVETGLFSGISNRLSYHQNTLEKYIQQPFSKEAFEKQMNLKKENYSSQNRLDLYDAIKLQYSEIEISESVKSNIELLKSENTYTITTGHQLSIFTGPIYFIYKILHVIKLTKELKETYPESNFVPVFWLASEDHDFEEIQSVTLFNKSLKWETEQKGPVGRFDFESFTDVIEEFKELFKLEDSEVKKLLEKYNGLTLGKASFSFVNELFKDFGLVQVDGDNVLLKKQFSSIMKSELETSFSFQAVQETNNKLSKEEIKLQVHPREINLFYIEQNFRERIQLKGLDFLIEGKGEFSKEELLKELESYPEKFSPNVILRPLYQETVLPNLCYLGGGGEMSYWLQLKGVFDAAKIVYPLIQVRNSLLFIDAGSEKKMSNLGLTYSELFKSSNDLKKQFVLKNSSQELDFFGLEKLVRDFDAQLKELAKNLNLGLESYAEAEITRFSKQVEGIEQKMIKAEKSKHEQSLNQIDHLKEKLFPGNGVQERSLNFFQLCTDGQVYSHLNDIYNVIDPFGNDLIIY